jgi:hypothetical protein
MLSRVFRRTNLALVALGAAALLVEGHLRAKSGVSPGAYALALAASVPFAWRTRAPIAALLGLEAGALACTIAFDASVAASGPSGRRGSARR